MAGTTGRSQQDLATDYAEALDDLQARMTTNTIATYERSLSQSMDELRRFYAGFTDKAILDDRDYQGNTRRPYEYSIRQATAKYGQMAKIASGFLPAKNMAALEAMYEQDLGEAMALGGDLSARLADLVAPQPKKDKRTAEVNPLALEAAVTTTSAYIRSETQAFRDQMAQLITGAMARGQGFRGVEKDIRALLNGSTDPNGLTKAMGLKQRADLIARSELANAYGEGQRLQAMKMGFGYVRWIATHDELTCAVCGSRHGLIYAVGDVVVPAHPRCRCAISPVPNEAVEAKDPGERHSLLDGDYWDGSRKEMEREFAKARGFDMDKARKALEKALRLPSPSERRRYPAATESLKPALGWPGEKPAVSAGPTDAERAGFLARRMLTREYFNGVIDWVKGWDEQMIRQQLVIMNKKRDQWGSKYDPTAIGGITMEAQYAAVRVARYMRMMETKAANSADTGRLAEMQENVATSPKYKAIPGKKGPLLASASKQAELDKLEAEWKVAIKGDINSVEDSQRVLDLNTKIRRLKAALAGDAPVGPEVAELYDLRDLHGKPELVMTEADLMKRKDLITSEADGQPVILYRGTTEMRYDDQLRGIGYDGEVHFAGRGIYGNGTYAASRPVVDDGFNDFREREHAMTTAIDYAGGTSNLEEGTPVQRVSAMGIRADANVRVFKGGFDAGAICAEALAVTGYKFSDPGAAMAAMGYDAYALSQGAQWYWVVFNRGALVIAETNYRE